MFAQGLRSLMCESSVDISVTTATSLREALVLIRAATAAGSPHGLVLLDWHLEDASGKEALPALRAASGPHVKVVVLSGEATPERMQAALTAGADGFIPKSYRYEVLRAAVAVVLEGGRFVPPELALSALRPPAQSAAPSLTPAQRKVLQLLARGLNNKRIATELGIEVATVKTHLTGVYVALGVTNRTEAALRAPRELLDEQ